MSDYVPPSAEVQARIASLNASQERVLASGLHEFLSTVLAEVDVAGGGVGAADVGAADVQAAVARLREKHGADTVMGQALRRADMVKRRRMA
eukprot:358446-Chlamydomonas_euryale.AAC.1